MTKTSHRSNPKASALFVLACAALFFQSCETLAPTKVDPQAATLKLSESTAKVTSVNGQKVTNYLRPMKLPEGPAKITVESSASTSTMFGGVTKFYSWSYGPDSFVVNLKKGRVYSPTYALVEMPNAWISGANGRAIHGVLDVTDSKSVVVITEINQTDQARALKILERGMLGKRSVSYSPGVSKETPEQASAEAPSSER